jgi:hypothetical protein
MVIVHNSTVQVLLDIDLIETQMVNVIQNLIVTHTLTVADTDKTNLE